MTIELYPTTPFPTYSYLVDHEYKTTLSDFELGVEHTAKRWTYPKRTFTLTYKALSMDQRNEIYDFFQNRMGPWESFHFYDFQQRRWTNQYVGTGDGITSTYDIPGKVTASAAGTVGFLTEDGNRIMAENGDHLIGDTSVLVVNVYVDGTETTDFSIGDGTGTNAADQIIFGGLYQPPPDSVITCDFSGYLRIKGRFKDDKLKEDIIAKDRVNMQVTIYEVKN